jgi:hypothetical protein
MTSSKRRHARALCILLAAGAAGACGGVNGDWQEEGSAVDTQQEPIMNGTAASRHPEAVLVDMYQSNVLRAACSGAVIAPRVVLTAGHCVNGYDGWRIAAPFARKQIVTTSDAAVYDWNNYPSTTVNPRLHDVALIFLHTPIVLDLYPAIASRRVADGTSVVNIGRRRDGLLSSSTLYMSQPLAIADATSVGFPNDYRASNVLETGDSGGPVEQTETHRIVAVNSGNGSGIEVLARVDFLYGWIEEQISTHGGW